MALRAKTYKLDSGARIEFYTTRILPTLKRQWRWRLVSGNGRTIVGTTEHYVDVRDADRALEITQEVLSELRSRAYVVEEQKDG